jgi:uncharacterized protein
MKLPRLCWILPFVAFFAFAGGARAQSPAGPSFSCAHPSAIEAIICGDAELSARDREMARLYAAVKVDLFGSGPSGQVADQRGWIKQRDATCADIPTMRVNYGNQRNCLMKSYGEQAKTLAASALFAVPDEALPVLRREAPKIAPLYEALYRYATIDDPVRRKQVVTALIAPNFNSHRAYGAIDFQIYKLARAADVAESDKAFSAYFDLVSVEIGAGLPVPCSALLKRPGLIETLTSKFGGGVDGSIPDSDCETMLPPLPELSDLSNAAWRAAPDCDGSIGKTTGRNINALEDAIRVHRTAFWNDRPGSQLSVNFPGGDVLAAKAQRALTRDYVTFFKTPQGVATKDADAALRLLTNLIATYCEE